MRQWEILIRNAKFCPFLSKITKFHLCTLSGLPRTEYYYDTGLIRGFAHVQFLLRLRHVTPMMRSTTHRTHE
jgi:hypothetical protein